MQNATERYFCCSKESPEQINLREKVEGFVLTENKTIKVLAINGSPKSNGNTAHSLQIIADTLEVQGIQTEMLHIGNQSIRGCTACGECSGKMVCTMCDDIVDEAIEKMLNADGIILGSPVYFSGVAGTMKSFLDRAFYVATRDRNLKGKVGAAVVAVRRSGGSSALDSLQHYIVYSEMTLVGSSYWPIVHGWKPGEMQEDVEAVDTLKMLAQNMAWVLRQREATKISFSYPEMEKRRRMGFIH